MFIIAERVQQMIPNLTTTIEEEYGIKCWIDLTDMECDYGTMNVHTSNGPEDQREQQYLVHLQRYDMNIDFTVVGDLWNDVLEGVRESYNILESNKKLLLLCI